MSRYWRVDFTEAGAVANVTELVGPRERHWVIVEAPDEKSARHKGYNIYCARKKRERVATLRAAGQCACGRRQDSVIEHGARKGEWALTCSVCKERRGVMREKAKERPGRTHEQAMAQRDEGARVVANLNRQRDRRGEIRLETLIEVRDRWINTRNVGLFGNWLSAEIDTLTGAKAS